MIVAFQPHLYSRTREFADGVRRRPRRWPTRWSCCEVYGAREDPEPGVSGALVADAVPLPAERVHYVPRWEEVPAVVAGVARSGDLVITMGAGDVTVLAPEILLELERRERRLMRLRLRRGAGAARGRAGARRSAAPAGVGRAVPAAPAGRRPDRAAAGRRAGPDRPGAALRPRPGRRRGRAGHRGRR